MHRGGPDDDDDFVLDDVDDLGDEGMDVGGLELEEEFEGAIDESSGVVGAASDDLEDDELLDGDVDSDTSVSCPYCGETTQISLDYGSGSVQEYIEDCEVCCRPWRVRVRYDRSGAAEVTIEPT